MNYQQLERRNSRELLTTTRAALVEAVTEEESWAEWAQTEEKRPLAPDRWPKAKKPILAIRSWMP